MTKYWQLELNTFKKSFIGDSLRQQRKGESFINSIQYKTYIIFSSSSDRANQSRQISDISSASESKKNVDD